MLSHDLAKQLLALPNVDVADRSGKLILTIKEFPEARWEERSKRVIWGLPETPLSAAQMAFFGGMESMPAIRLGNEE
jgi:hypothetical protein